MAQKKSPVFFARFPLCQDTPASRSDSRAPNTKLWLFPYFRFRTSLLWRTNHGTNLPSYLKKLESLPPPLEATASPFHQLQKGNRKRACFAAPRFPGFFIFILSINIRTRKATIPILNTVGILGSSTFFKIFNSSFYVSPTHSIHGQLQVYYIIIPHKCKCKLPMTAPKQQSPDDYSIAAGFPGWFPARW